MVRSGDCNARGMLERWMELCAGTCFPRTAVSAPPISLIPTGAHLPAPHSHLTLGDRTLSLSGLKWRDNLLIAL